MNKAVLPHPQPRYSQDLRTSLYFRAMILGWIFEFQISLPKFFCLWVKTPVTSKLWQISKNY